MKFVASSISALAALNTFVAVASAGLINPLVDPIASNNLVGVGSSNARRPPIPALQALQIGDKSGRIIKRSRYAKKSFVHNKRAGLPTDSIAPVNGAPLGLLGNNLLTNAGNTPLSNLNNPVQNIGTAPLSNANNVASPINNALAGNPMDTVQKAAAQYVPANVAQVYNQQAKTANGRLSTVQKSVGRLVQTKKLNGQSIVKTVKTGRLSYGPVKGNLGNNAKKLQRIQKLRQSVPLPRVAGLGL